MVWVWTNFFWWWRALICLVSLFNPLFLTTTMLYSASFQLKLMSIGYSEPVHLMSSTSAELSERKGIKSTHLFEKVCIETVDFLPSLCPNQITFWFTEENQAQVWSFVLPQLGVFQSVGRKALYITCVKVSHLQESFGLVSNKWTELFGISYSLRGRWWCLYNPLLDTWAADLQWRILNGVIATWHISILVQE